MIGHKTLLVLLVVSTFAVFTNAALASTFDDKYIERLGRSEWEADWIWCPGPDGKADLNICSLHAAKVIELPGTVTDAYAYVAAGQTYILYINGVRAGSNLDPLAAGYVDLLDLSSYFHPGRNVIVIKVWNPDTLIRGDYYKTRIAGILFEGEITCRGASGELLAVSLATDPAWRVTTEKIILPHYGRASAVRKVYYEEFDYSAWENAVARTLKPYLFTHIEPDRYDGSSEPISAEIRMHGGVPTIFIDGRPNTGIVSQMHGPVYAVDPQRPDIIRAKADAGMHIFKCDMEGEWFRRPDETFQGFPVGRNAYVRYIGSTLLADPDAYIFSRSGWGAPEYWIDLHPECELVVHGDTRDVSFACEAWKEYIIGRWTRRLNYVKNLPYGNRLKLHLIGAGLMGEWHIPTADCLDHTQSCTDAFRTWLKAQYKDVEALRKAWVDDSVDFETAATPTSDEMRYGRDKDLFLFYDPAKSRKALDFFRFYNDMTADTIIRFARAIKQVTPDTICGPFYGYQLAWATYATPLHPTYAFTKLFESDAVDFVSSPLAYRDRGLGGHSATQGVHDSARLHGKLVISEVDSPGHVKPDGPHRRDVYRREFAWSMIKGFGLWWGASVNSDAEKGIHGEPRCPYILETIQECQRIGNFALETNRSQVAEIALVFDEESFFYTGGAAFYGPLLHGMREAVSRVGAPHDLILLDDLALSNCPDYKVYVFLNAWRLTEGQMEMIDRKVKRGGATALWMYAPGFVSEDGLDVSGAEKATGIKLAYDAVKAPLAVRLEAAESDLLRGMSVGLVVGDKDAVAGPLFYCEDVDVEVLGALTANGKPGLVVKRFPEWTSIWCGADLLPVELLRNICAESGVHVYCETGDFVCANAQWLCIHTKEDRTATFTLPKESSVYDAFDRTLVAENTDRFEMEIPAYTTKLFYLGDYKKLESFLEVGE